MKKMKPAFLAITVIAAFVLSAQSAYASSVAFWSYSSWTTNNGAYFIYSDSFTKSSTDDSTITISGWQDTEVSTAVNLDYNIVEKSWFSETKHGSTYTLSSNYPESDPRFSYVFNNIPTQKTLYVRVYSSDGHSLPVSGAGNAYD